MNRAKLEVSKAIYSARMNVTPGHSATLAAERFANIPPNCFSPLTQSKGSELVRSVVAAAAVATEKGGKFATLSQRPKSQNGQA